jgi:anti-anti-sigma regulatory factor
VTPDLHIESSIMQEAIVLQLSGMLTATAHPPVSHLLANVLAAAPPPSLVVIDLRRLEVLSADGVRLLRVFVRALNRKRVACRLVVPTAGVITHILDLADPAHELDRFPDLHRCLTGPAIRSPDPPISTGSASVSDRAVDSSVAQALGDVARSLQQPDSLHDTWNAVTAAAVSTVPGAQYAGLMIARPRGNIETTAVTADLVGEVDQAQYATREGPCLDAVDRHVVVRVSNMTHETRWPHFSRRAVQLGVHSTLSLQLYVAGQKFGGLNLYARQPHTFDKSENIGRLFATHAAVAIAGAQREDHLHQAVAGRDIVGQAKGILMERYKITPDEAFRLLARISQNTNTKVTEVARELTETGQLPQDRTGRAHRSQNPTT